MRKLFISLCFSACCSLLAAQTTNPIQEAMANYDYETALMLIDQETPTVPLLYQKGKALKGLGNNLEALSVFQEVVAHYPLNIFSEIPFYRLSLYISYLQMFSFGLNTHEISLF